MTKSIAAYEKQTSSRLFVKAILITAMRIQSFRQHFMIRGASILAQKTLPLVLSRQVCVEKKQENGSQNLFLQSSSQSTSQKSYRKIAVLLAVVSLLLSSTAFAVTIPRIYTYHANKIGVPAKLLYAISVTESTNPKTGKVWPWTINVKGNGYYFSSKEAAYRAIQSSLSKGIKSIDIGPMQTNWKWQKDRLGSTWKALDPSFNIQVGAQILRACYLKKKDWWECAGDYHTLSNTPERAKRAKRYRKLVYKNLPKGT